MDIGPMVTLIIIVKLIIMDHGSWIIMDIRPMVTLILIVKQMIMLALGGH